MDKHKMWRVLIKLWIRRQVSCGDSTMLSDTHFENIWEDEPELLKEDFKKSWIDLFKFVSCADEDILDDDNLQSIIEKNEGLEILHKFMYRSIYQNKVKTRQALNWKISAQIFEDIELMNFEDDTKEETKQYYNKDSVMSTIDHKSIRSHTMNTHKCKSWDETNIIRWKSLLKLIQMDNLN